MLFLRAQSTIEYLIILSVIIVIALIITVLFSSSFSFLFTNVNTTSPRISSSSGVVGIDGTVIDYQGNGLVGLGNNSNEDLIITRIRVNGVDTNYIDTVMLPGSEKIFSISDVSSGCSCEGFIGRQKTCDVIIYAESESGVPRQFPVTVSVDCVQEVTSVNLNEVVLPESDPFLWAYSASVVLNVIDSSSLVHLTDVNVDCNVNAYDSTVVPSPISVDFNVGSYSCILSADDYTSDTLIIVVPDLNSQSYVIGLASSSAPPSGTSITLNVIDSNSLVHLTDVNMDCNVNDYDLNIQASYFVVDFNVGSYSCVFYKSGYTSNTKYIVVPDSSAQSYVIGLVSSSLPPSSSGAAITFNVVDFNSSAHLTDVNMDCNVNAYDLNIQASYFVVDFNVGSYSCVFYKSGYTSKTLSVVVPDLNAKPYVVTMFRPWYTAFMFIIDKGTVIPLEDVKAYCTGQYDLNSPGWPPKIDSNSDANGDMNRNFFNGTHTCTFVKDGYYTTISNAVIADANANLTVEMEVVAAPPPM